MNLYPEGVSDLSASMTIQMDKVPVTGFSPSTPFKNVDRVWSKANVAGNSTEMEVPTRGGGGTERSAVRKHPCKLRASDEI